MNEETLQHDMDEVANAPYYVHTKKEITQKPQEEWEEWTKGRVAMTCHNCGQRTYWSDEIETGIQFVLPITNHHAIIFECKHCNSLMEIAFEKGETAEVVENVEEIIDLSPGEGGSPEDAEVINLNAEDEEAKDIDLKVKEDVQDNETVEQPTEDESKEESTEAQLV